MRWFCAAAVIGIGLLNPVEAFAGMPSVRLTEVSQSRFQDVSFFLWVFLLATLAIRYLWNFLAKDFAWMPTLSFGKACAMVSLWGTLFVLVLTMISGARELMTPEAWVPKPGRLTYQLKEAGDKEVPAATQENQEVLNRVAGLTRLAERLRIFCEENGGSYPHDIAAANFPDDLWDYPVGSGGLRYELVGGRRKTDGDLPLVREPNLHNNGFWVLTCAGEIAQVDPSTGTNVVQPLSFLPGESR